MTSESEKQNLSEIPEDAPHIPDVAKEMVPQKMPPAPENLSDEKPDSLEGNTPPKPEETAEPTEAVTKKKPEYDAWDDGDNPYDGENSEAENAEQVQETDYDKIEAPVKKRFPIEKFGVQHPKFKQTSPEILEFYWDYIGKAIIPQIKLNHAQFIGYFHYGTLFGQFYPMPNYFNIRVMINRQEYINLSLPKDLVNFILHPLIEPLSILELGDDVIMNLLEVSFAPYLENFEKTFGFHITFEIAESAMQSDAFFTQWVLQEANTGQSCAVNLFGNKDNIKDFLDKVYKDAKPNPKIKPSVSLSVISAIKQFPVQKVKSLKHGEIIIILTDRHLVNEPLAVIGQRLVVNTQVTGDKLKIESEPKQMSEIVELNMNQGETPPDQTAEQKSIADNVTASMTDMRVPVTFELARMDLPVASLSNLGQGQILDLNKQIDENVSIVVNGKVVAVGEVVQVGRNFGVIIKEVV